MRKRVRDLALIFVLCIILFVGFASSQEHVAEINKAFQCLDSRVSSSSLSLEEAVFVTLAKVPGQKANNTINSQKSGSEFCWPAGNCKIEDSAQVALAKISMGENAGNITKWLVTQSGATENMLWFLQITPDKNGAAECVVNYDGRDYSVSITSDMKLTGNPGTCLKISSSGYWLEIQSSCIEKEYSVQCDDSFKTNLLYKKTDGETIFVSANTHGAAAGAWTVEKISAKCFKQGGVCDYEGSLWATLALYSNQEDISEFTPYLRAVSEDNLRYFPSSFLNALAAGGNEHYSSIIDSRKFRPEGGYWEMSNTAYNKFYDTSLAMLAFGGMNSPEITETNVIGYLIEHQDSSGCWNGDNIRDTAFVVYSAKWLRSAYGICGNGVIDGAEQCDCGEDGKCSSAELGGSSCSSLDYEGGNLTCGLKGSNNECRFVTEECVGEPSVCGDGIISGAEQCDCGEDESCSSAELDDESCQSLGYENGTLGCVPKGEVNECKFNSGGCSGDAPGSISGGSGGGSYNPSGVTDCELKGLFCVPSISDCLGAGGTYFPQTTHSCYNPYEYCCTKDVAATTCNSLGGRICASADGETCSGSTVQSDDGPCCLDSCTSSTVSCSSDNDCFSNEVCLGGECVRKEENGGTPTPSKESNLWIWIIVLAILILLVVLGIIFRDKLRVWWFKVRGKTKTSKVPPANAPMGMARRPVPLFGMPRPMPPRPMPASRNAARPSAKTEQKTSKKTSEEDDTFKKLKEMSK